MSTTGKKRLKIQTWRLNNMLLNNQQITEEIRKEIKICIKTNENENTTTQNLWDSVKAVLRERFIAIQAYLKKQEKKSNNLTLHLQQLDKEEIKNPRLICCCSVAQLSDSLQHGLQNAGLPRPSPSPGVC